MIYPTTMKSYDLSAAEVQMHVLSTQTNVTASSANQSILGILFLNQPFRNMTASTSLFEDDSVPGAMQKNSSWFSMNQVLNYGDDPHAFCDDGLAITHLRQAFDSNMPKPPTIRQVNIYQLLKLFFHTASMHSQLPHYCKSGALLMHLLSSCCC